MRFFDVFSNASISDLQEYTVYTNYICMLLRWYFILIFHRNNMKRNRLKIQWNSLYICGLTTKTKCYNYDYIDTRSF